MQVVGGNWSYLVSRMLLTTFNPATLSILGNILIISNLTNLQSDVNVLLLFKLSIIVSISDVSFTLLSIFKTSQYKHFSTKTDKFSLAAPHPLVITLTGLPASGVLINPFILPGFARKVSINLHQVLSGTLCCFHFLTHDVTFLRNLSEGLHSNC